MSLFGSLRRIVKQWLDECLVCEGGTYPGLLLYQDLCDKACNRINAAITRSMIDRNPVKALLDPYNPVGSTSYISFFTTKANLWTTDSRRCQINYAVLDGDWEAEFCRVAENHSRVLAYVKNHNMGFEIPYRRGSERHKYVPDYIVLVDDGHGADDLLHLIVEIKGYRGEDAKDKKDTTETYWLPGVNRLKTFGRWAFAEFTSVYAMESDFAEKMKQKFDELIADVCEEQGTAVL
jgi:type III restriction enzyme